MEAASCEIARLPEELLATIISLTSPPDACRAAAVSRAFCASAESDSVWSCFLPRDLPLLADGELPNTPPPSTKKGMFLRLSDTPALLPCRLVSMWLEKFSGAKCYKVSARALQISFGDMPAYRDWIHFGREENKGDKRFLHALELTYCCGLDIRAKVQRKMLSENTTYVAYMVFKLADRFYGLDFPFQEASFGIAGSESTIRQVCLQGYTEDGVDGTDEPPRKHFLPSCYYPKRHKVSPRDDVVFPRRKADGWMEVELGEFHNEEGGGEVSISLTENTLAKRGLIVWGIEIRCKQQRPSKEYLR